MGKFVGLAGLLLSPARRAGLSGHSCCGAEAVPHGPALLAQGAVLGQGCCCALLVNDRCRSSAVAVFTVVDTPVFAQWLIPMVSAMEVSQLQFDKVVLVPVVQVCSSILQVASCRRHPCRGAKADSHGLAR